ncbi:hypothetical protein VNO78_32548 [Psophocarpus tetragonolobus]|uniref:Uncharacterized protein n=1 Tax=Psophocarpus tetragonolobus TaxID=3891 RepID=A0AAN9P2U0_PSOTE
MSLERAIVYRQLFSFVGALRFLTIVTLLFYNDFSVANISMILCSVARTKQQLSIEPEPVKKSKKPIHGESSRSQPQAEEEEHDPTLYEDTSSIKYHCENEDDLVIPSPPPSSHFPSMAEQLRVLKCDIYDIRQKLEANHRSMDFLVEQFRNYAAYTTPAFPLPSPEAYTTYVAWPVLPGHGGGSEAANDDGIRGTGTSIVAAQATEDQEQVGGEVTRDAS